MRFFPSCTCCGDCCYYADQLSIDLTGFLQLYDYYTHSDSTNPDYPAAFCNGLYNASGLNGTYVMTRIPAFGHTYQYEATSFPPGIGYHIYLVILRCFTTYWQLDVIPRRNQQDAPLLGATYIRSETSVQTCSPIIINSTNFRYYITSMIPICDTTPVATQNATVASLLGVSYE